jgi:hypothetical protein
LHDGGFLKNNWVRHKTIKDFDRLNL